MAKRALRPGEHGVVIGQHGAGAAVDARRAGDEAVGRGARDQVVQIAAKPLRGDREAAVFDERPRVDQILDVSPRGVSVGSVPAFDGVGPGGVFGERATPQQFGVIGADVLGRWASVAQGV
jgi:hypothetical protein